jgi:diguanylate cyclase (GGDEF)-like protein
MLRPLLFVAFAALLHVLPAEAASLRPAAMSAIDAAVLDDPRDAIRLAQSYVGSDAPPDMRFWALLGVAEAHNMLEHGAEASAALASAQATLDAWPESTPGHRGWLELMRLHQLWPSQEPRQAREQLAALQRSVRPLKDDLLNCEVQQLDLALLLDADSLDEAWLAAEALERCGRELAHPSLESGALLAMGTIAGRGRGRGQADADLHFERALKSLGDQPARLSRSIVLWERGNAMRQSRRWEDAARYYEAATVLSREIGDNAGVAAADTGLAETLNRRNQPAAALPLLAEARRLLEASDSGYRMLAVASHTIEAQAMLRRPEVISEIGRARRWDTSAQPALARAKLARAMASGYASQGRFAEAYAETQRAERFVEDGRQDAADVQTLRLQARYAAAQRDAENAELRHRSEAARLALEAQAARQRALWAALAALGLVSVAALAFGWRAIARRRVMADLALRDELTGAPNRRAVTAYAQAQLEQARRLGVPLTLALLDLDNFKRLNDTLGHAAGDAVLHALVRAAQGVLRGQDRLGRWGGEEWLLVMPGTSVHEVPAVFERLRERFAATPAEGMEQPHGCTFSMGAAALDAAGGSLEALVARCDGQLYRAKQEGRDRVCLAP